MGGLIVHEWIEKIGGAERVIDNITQVLPGADILCLWNDAPDRYPGHNIEETWLARTPLRNHKALALLTMPPTWRKRTSHDYDWAFVSSHLFAHHVSFKNESPDFRKYVYAYTPARYVWDPELDPRGQGLIPLLVSPYLRRLDKKRAQESTQIAAISDFVKQRISDTWGRDSIVIYPPVDVKRISDTPDWRAKLTDVELAELDFLPAEFILGASRLVTYKRLDSVIDAGEAAGIPVVIAGSGPERLSLISKASEARVPVHFVAQPSDAMLYALYQRALAFVFLAIEDFGIMPVEAMAAGTPVVARNIGGAAETVIHDRTGVLIESVDSTSLKKAVEAAINLDGLACRQQAELFDAPIFQANVRQWLGKDAIESQIATSPKR